MSRAIIEVDHNLPQRDLFKFLKDNKKALIAQKKMGIKQFECPSFYTPFEYNDKGGTAVKATGETVIPDTATSLMVDAAMNTSMWCDTAMDVLLRDSGKKSIKERKGLIPHIHDHLWETDAEVGDVKNIFYQDVPLRQLGVKLEGTGQVLTFSTEILRGMNDRIFEKYRTKRVRQHSIGLRYQELLLAINEPDDEYWEEEYKVYKKYIDQIINKELPESLGYFWAVPQYMLLEGSCVLFGANALTPVLATSEKAATNDEPEESTQSGSEKETFDIGEAIKTAKFF